MELSKHQQQLLLERAFMLKTKVQKSALPVLTYIVHCFTCNIEGRVESPARDTLDERHIYAGLIIQGWFIGPRGFQCEACYSRDIEDIIAAADKAAGMTIGDTRKSDQGTAGC
jgi:hypothetical protein